MTATFVEQIDSIGARCQRTMATEQVSRGAPGLDISQGDEPA